MRMLGFEITRAKAAPSGLQQPDGRGGWWPIVREPFSGAWQRNVEIRQDTVLTYSAVFACVTLIASDISKLWLELVESQPNDIWTLVERQSPHWRVIRRPNRFQNRIKFFEWWMLSKLIHGNTYALKVREQGRGMVQALYILDPTRVKPLIAPDGAVYYQLVRDPLSTIEEDSPVVPASEIIHDIMSPLFHPLVGVSPIFACGIAAMQGLSIQKNSTQFFENGSQPSGVLTAPHAISNDVADRLQKHWEENFAGANNVGKVAVLGDGLSYEPMSRNAVDSQLIEQLKWTGETVCSVFHVPPYMVGIGPMPTYNNIEALNAQYYSQCLQSLIEALELCLDEGLEMPPGMGVRFNLDALLRMDTATAIKSAADGIGAGFMTPNEARAKFDLQPVKGGDTPYKQQQEWPLWKLSERDDAPPSRAEAQQPPVDTDDEPDVDDVEKAFGDALTKELVFA